MLGDWASVVEEGLILIILGSLYLINYLEVRNKINIDYFNKSMSKQKLAELVMQKMKEKKQLEERNRPHYEVLQLLVKFEIQQHHKLTQQISQLQQQISKEQTFLRQLNENCQQLESTGKKNYPRFIIQPNFIASENINALTKQFYRKSSNTFLRQQLLKTKQYQKDCEIYAEIKQKILDLKGQQDSIQKLKAKTTSIINDKRVRNLKEDLRLRGLRAEIQSISQTINNEKQENKGLIAEYQLKKTNLQNRVEYSKKLAADIEKQKNLIQNVYNPVTYRDYLKTIFGIRIKNQLMHTNLIKVSSEVGRIEEHTSKTQRFLEKVDNLFVKGKCADSPSKKKRKKHQSTSNLRSGSLTVRRKTQSLGQSGFKQTSRTLKKSKNSSTFSGSLGRTQASSTFNFKQSASKQKITNSPFSKINKMESTF